jgi:hypothetical protein
MTQAEEDAIRITGMADRAIAVRQVLNGGEYHVDVGNEMLILMLLVDDMSRRVWALERRVNGALK